MTKPTARELWDMVPRLDLIGFDDPALDKPVSMVPRLPRGARVNVRFEDHGPEHLPFEWTGRVVGPSRIPGRVRIKPEYVTWKGPIHLKPEGESEPVAYTVTRIAKDAPTEYHEHRPNGLHVVRPKP